jgi:hypothetical protein
MAKVVSGKATSNGKVAVPAELDVVDVLRTLAGCADDDMEVVVERRTSSAGNPLFYIGGSVVHDGVPYQVSLNVTAKVAKADKTKVKNVPAKD